MSFGNKFFAHKVEYDGIMFDSTFERDRYIVLRDMERNGEIECLRLQTGFTIIPRVTTIVPKQLKTKVRYDERVVEMETDYHCDFCYKENGYYVIEEDKSHITAKVRDYPLRRKLMIQKIAEHNAKGRGQWLFREAIYYRKGKVKITDKRVQL